MENDKGRLWNVRNLSEHSINDCIEKCKILELANYIDTWKFERGIFSYCTVPMDHAFSNRKL